jgi:hypothetical protein
MAPDAQHTIRRNGRRRDCWEHRHWLSPRVSIQGLQMRDIHARHSGALSSASKACNIDASTSSYRVKRRSTSCACSAQRYTPFPRSRLRTHKTTTTKRGRMLLDWTTPYGPTSSTTPRMPTHTISRPVQRSGHRRRVDSMRSCVRPVPVGPWLVSVSI